MTSLRPDPDSRFLCSFDESLSGMFRRLPSLKDIKASLSSCFVGWATFVRPSEQQAFSCLSRAPHDPVMAGAVHFEFDAFAPALVVHGAVPSRGDK